MLHFDAQPMQVEFAEFPLLLHNTSLPCSPLIWDMVSVGRLRYAVFSSTMLIPHRPSPSHLLRQPVLLRGIIESIFHRVHAFVETVG